MINIFVRNDLNMRKGKIASQAAHAYMSIIKNFFFNLSCDHIIIKENNYKFFTEQYNSFDYLNFENYVKNIKINKVDSEEEAINHSLLSPFNVRIIDSGLTEFNGNPTLTTTANITLNHNFQFKNDLRLKDCKDNKQVLIVNSDIKQDKFELAPYAAYAFLSAIIQLYNIEEINYINQEIRINIKQNPILKDYLFGKFKKITLKANSEEIFQLKELLEKEKVKDFIELKSDNHHSLCFNVKDNDFFNKYTSHLKLY